LRICSNALAAGGKGGWVGRFRLGVKRLVPFAALHLAFAAQRDL
jgi:hypothetical protein